MRLKELSALLTQLRNTVQLVQVFESYLPRFKSKRLTKLVTVKRKGKDGLFPDVNAALNQLE
jgi:hypothetical protein